MSGGIRLKSLGPITAKDFSLRVCALLLEFWLARGTRHRRPFLLSVYVLIGLIGRLGAVPWIIRQT